VYLLNSQHRFTKKHSTTTAAVAEVLDHITQPVVKRKRVLGLFIDISKAFDAINHDVLLNKLKWYGVRDVGQLWFKNYILVVNLACE
jgi:hypothetical protein